MERPNNVGTGTQTSAMRVNAPVKQLFRPHTYVRAWSRTSSGCRANAAGDMPMAFGIHFSYTQFIIIARICPAIHVIKNFIEHLSCYCEAFTSISGCVSQSEQQSSQDSHPGPLQQ